MKLKFLCIMLALNPVYAESWDLSSGFSQTDNPAGPWSWGWLAPGHELTPYSTPDSYDGGATGWQNHYLNHSGRAVRNGLPGYVENESCYRPGQVVLQPGIHVDKPVAVRWTSKSQAAVRIDARFMGLNHRSGTTTGVYVHHNGRALFRESINGFSGCPEYPASGNSPGVDFLHVLQVNPGDYIDFSVDHGGNGAHAVETGAGNDSTGLDLVISEVASGYGQVSGFVTARIPQVRFISGARIQTLDGTYSTLSGKDGRFEMMLPEGDHHLQMEYPGFPARESGLTVSGATTTTLEFGLEAGALVGVVRAEGPGRPPLLGCLVRMDDSPFFMSTTSGGSFVLVAPPGSYRVSIQAHGYEKQHLDTTLVAGESIFENISLKWSGLMPMDPENFRRVRRMAANYPQSNLPGVDLSWHMDRAIEYMLDTMDRAQGGLPWSVNRIYFPPAVIEHSDGDLPHNTARYLLAMMAWEDATGQRVGDEAAVQMLRSLLHGCISGEDHLAHTPNPEKKDMALLDMHSRREALLALLGLARTRGDRESADLAVRMIDSLVEEEAGGVKPSPLVSPRMIRSLIMHHRYSGHEPSVRLASRYAETEIPRVFDNRGRVTLSHMHSVLGALSGLVELGLHVADSRYLEKARLVIDRGLTPHRTRFGFIFETDMAIGRGEANNPADLVRSEILLGLNGHPQYLDDAERIVRNHLLASQFLDPSLAGSPAEGDPLPDDSPGARYSDAAERLCGGFSFTAPNDLVDGVYYERFDMAADLASGAIEGLAAVWRSIVTEDAGGLKVNFLFSRDTPAVNVRSHIPVQGRVELDIRKPADVFVRIPSYVDLHGLRVTLNGHMLEDLRVTGSYLHIPKTSGVAKAVVEFEQVVAFRETQLGGQEYTEEWLGDTLWNILPRGERIPLYYPARLALYGMTP